MNLNNTTKVVSLIQEKQDLQEIIDANILVGTVFSDSKQIYLHLENQLLTNIKVSVLKRIEDINEELKTL